MALRIAEQGRTALLVELPRPIGDHSIAKVRTRRARVNNPVQRRVNELDPRGERFALAQNKLLKGVFNKTQTRALEAAANEPLRQVVTLMPRYAPLDAKQLTRRQYRHLRASVELLAKNDILHGDLPDNVMLNPQTGMPVIIDFDESVAPSKQTNIDRNAFMTHFKVKRQ